VALCGWLIPGAGYWMIGQRVRAAIICIVVLLMFAAGTLIGGIAVVSAPTQFSPGAILDKPWFIGQVLAGPVSIAAAAKASGTNPADSSTSRSWELGTLYTAIAGMLNLLALMDAAWQSGNPASGDGTAAGAGQGSTT
jgi:hypothetical protein